LWHISDNKAKLAPPQLLVAATLTQLLKITLIDLNINLYHIYAMIAHNLVIIARSFKSIVTEGNPLGLSKTAMGQS
jgi:hypothetical protein